MPSTTAIQAALAGWTTEQFLECLTVDHDDWTAPLYLVNDQQNLTRSAGTFIAFPFRSRLHSRSEDQALEAEIIADNVDQRLVEGLRGLSDGGTVTYEVVLRDTPNTVEQGPMEFEIVGFVGNIQEITLRIAFELGFLGEAFPQDYFAPYNSPDDA